MNSEAEMWSGRGGKGDVQSRNGNVPLRDATSARLEAYLAQTVESRSLLLR